MSRKVLTPTGRTMILRVDHVYDESGATVWEEVKGFWAEDPAIKAAIYKVKLRLLNR